MVEALEAKQLLAAFVVTTAADTGVGSLRQAISDANANPGYDAITFNIPGGGVQTITPTTPLPDVTDPTLIDATTQPGYAGTPLIQLNGGNIFYNLPYYPPNYPIPNVNGLTLAGGESTVKGLDINRFSGYGIGLSGDGNTISGDFIGTDPTGTRSQGNSNGGIYSETRENQIGGSGAANRNLISGNGGYGITLASAGNLPTNNRVQGNFIGTDVTGSNDLGNLQGGINVQSSGNLIGGQAAVLANTIAFNGGAGVQVGYYGYQQNVNGNAILGNSIYQNIGLGIDIGYTGVSNYNYGSYSPNRGINFPTLASAYPVSGGTAVEGTYSGIPDSFYRIEFFANQAPDPSGYGQGQTFLGSTSVLTDDSGNAEIFTTLTNRVPAGEYLTATATDSLNDTSEFSKAIPISSTAKADVSVAFTSPGTPLTLGSDLVYVLSVSNSGPSRATNVTLTDPLPSGVSFVSANPTQGTADVSNGTVTVNFGTLDSGSTAGLVLVVHPTVVAPITNTVTVKADQPDPMPANNSASQTVVTVPVPPTDLSVLVTAAPPAVALGQDLTYVVEVANFGPSPASGVTVTDNLPSAASVLSSKSTQGTTSISNGVLTANLGILPVGSTALITIVLQPGAIGLAVSQATVTSDQADDNIVNNVSALSTPVVANTLPPSVLGQTLKVSGQSITAVVLSFDKDMNATMAGNLANYAIQDLGNKKTPNSSGPAVSLASATYDPVTRSVTLVPSSPLAVGRFYQLTVNGPGAPGITDNGGIPLDGDRNGLAGGIYTSLFGRGTRTQPTSLQIGATVPQPPPSGSGSSSSSSSSTSTNSSTSTTTSGSTTTTKTRHKLVHHDKSTTTVTLTKAHAPKPHHRAKG